MISATDLSTYLFCPRKLYLSKVLKWLDPPSKAMIQGIIRHNALELVTYKEELLVLSLSADLNLDAVRNLYLRNFKAALRDAVIKVKHQCKSVGLPLLEAYNHALPYLERMAVAQAERVYALMVEKAVYGAELWNALVPKIKPEIKLRSQILDISGIIDQLHIYPNKLLPVELKTGKTPCDGPWPGHKVQLGAYILLLQEAYAVDIDVGTIHYLDSDRKFDVVMNPFFRQEILDLRDSIRLLFSAQQPPPVLKSANKCDACSFKVRCHGLKT